MGLIERGGIYARHTIGVLRNCALAEKHLFVTNREAWKSICERTYDAIHRFCASVRYGIYCIRGSNGGMRSFTAETISPLEKP